MEGGLISPPSAFGGDPLVRLFFVLRSGKKALRFPQGFFGQNTFRKRDGGRTAIPCFAAGFQSLYELDFSQAEA